MRNNIFISLTLLLAVCVRKGLSVWCYECVSTQPGCGPQLNWLWHWTTVCPEEEDVCVKILERRNSEIVITRSCLSSIQGLRSDIPADKYEGCRPAVVDTKLSNYVNNSIKELDIYRKHYDETTFCFCFLDHWCNSSGLRLPSFILLFGSMIVALFYVG